jgi:hypothetical protein
MSNRIMAASFVVFALAFMALGALIHHQWTKPTVSVAREAFSQQERLADGSVKAAKVPVPEKVMPPAPHIIPKGSKEERRISVTVKPAPLKRDPQPFNPDPDGQCRVPDTLTCPPVTVDLSIVRNKDGRDVIASSPDGTVLTAINIPIEESRRDYRHSIDAIYGGKDRYSVIYMRETTILGIPVGMGGGAIRFDDELVPAIGLRARF